MKVQIGVWSDGADTGHVQSRLMAARAAESGEQRLRRGGRGGRSRPSQPALKADYRSQEILGNRGRAAVGLLQAGGLGRGAIVMWHVSGGQAHFARERSRGLVP